MAAGTGAATAFTYPNAARDGNACTRLSMALVRLPMAERGNAITGKIADPRQAAVALGEFIASIQRIDAAGGPAPGPHNSHRSVPLAARDQAVRNAIANFTDDRLDNDMATSALGKRPCKRRSGKAPVWLHGDLHPGNLLVEQGRLTAVIDFGTLGIGDPACDLMVAWTFLSSPTRDVFRAAIPADDATWARGRGWALSFGLIAYAYYFDKNPVLAAISKRTIDEVLAERATEGL